MNTPTGIVRRASLNFLNRKLLWLANSLLVITLCACGGGGSDSTPTSAAPIVTSHPQGTTVAAGQPATFNVVATGNGPLAYQWRRGSVNIAGATNSTYSFVAGLGDSGAAFSVVVTNGAGSATSNSATVTVTGQADAPSFTLQPTSTSVVEGQSATFSVTAAGTATLFYQWRRNGTNVVGATGPSYTTPPAALTESGDVFNVVVTNFVSGITSHDAILTVTPAPPALPLSGITMISAGGSHSLALRANGTVVAWGINIAGELGIGSTSPTFTARAVAVPSLTNVTRIAACTNHSLALLGNGTVRAWGSNLSGKLGTGSVATHVATPTLVSGLTNVIAIACGEHHSLAVTNGGSVWAWGRNLEGALGDGTTTQRDTPVAVFSLAQVTSIAAAVSHSVALRQDGSVWAWGESRFVGKGAAYESTTPITRTPVQVPQITATRIATGSAHTLVLHADGTASAWGSNGFGELGDPSFPVFTFDPISVTNLTGATIIAGGIRSSSAAILTNGAVRTWGANDFGQLGDGTFVNRTSPGAFNSAGTHTAISTGLSHTLVLRSDGTVIAVGRNNVGQLGDGTQVDQTVPVVVLEPQ